MVFGQWLLVSKAAMCGESVTWGWDFWKDDWICRVEMEWDCCTSVDVVGYCHKGQQRVDCYGQHVLDEEPELRVLVCEC